jgi:hypothetical protein
MRSIDLRQHMGACRRGRASSFRENFENRNPQRNQVLSVFAWIGGGLQDLFFPAKIAAPRDEWRGGAGFNGSDGRRSKARQEKLSMDSGNSSQPESVANDN